MTSIQQNLQNVQNGKMRYYKKTKNLCIRKICNVVERKQTIAIVTYDFIFLEGFDCRGQGCHIVSLLLLVDIIFNTLE